jgi:hypothetical protein
MADAKRTRADILQERLVWLEKNLASLEHDQQRVPYLALTLLGVPVAWYFAGGLAALLVGITSIGLTSVSAYVVWAHRNEYTVERQSVRRELSALVAKNAA